MANFCGITASNGVKVKNVKKLQNYLSGFTFGSEGSIEHSLDESMLYLWGNDWFSVYPLAKSSNGLPDPDGEIDHDNECGDDFFKGLQSFLKEDMVIQCIGSEKCRFPLASWEIKIPVKGKIIYNQGFKFSDA